MTKQELIDAINNQSTVIFDGIRCKAVGYQVLIVREHKLYSAGLRAIKTDTLHWVEVSKVMKEGD